LEEKTFTNISLFSGAGGMDIGLNEAGFQTRVCVENDKFCQQTLENNHSKLQYQHSNFKVFGDVTQVSPAELLHQSGLVAGDVDLVSGGPPCQAFSTAGNRESINDPRGTLFQDFVRVVGLVKPRFFVMENVRGIRSAALKHRPLNKRGDEHPPLEDEEQLGSMLNLGILPEFEKLAEYTGAPYQIIFGTLNALDYGAAQDRERMIFIGSRDHELCDGLSIKDVVVPTHDRKGADGKLPAEKLKAVIKGLEDDPGPGMSYSPERAKIYKRIPEGKNWRYIRDNIGKKFTQQELEDFMGGAYNSTGGRVGFWRRLDYEKWSPTLTTSPVQKATGLCHPTKNRPLSVREYAKIQGFPDNWEFAGSVASQYRQIGNAVPTDLGAAVGNAIAQIMRPNI